MDQPNDQSIEQLVGRLCEGTLAREQFIALLVGLGASATTIATLTATASEASAPLKKAAAATHTAKKSAHHVAHQNTQLHHRHIRVQGSGLNTPTTKAPGTLTPQHMEKLKGMLDDYADHAIVEDPLFDAPFVGKEAITQRKMAEMASMSNISFEVVQRFAHHDQVVAEWVARGTHHSPFLGFPASGRSFEIRGVTVVTRHQGKIVKETLHYDLAEVQRQLG